MGYSNLSDMAPRWSKSKKEFIISNVKTFCIENSRRKKDVVKRDKNITLTGKVSYMIRNTSHTLLNGPTSRICNMILFFCWYTSLFIKFKSYSRKTFFLHTLISDDCLWSIWAFHKINVSFEISFVVFVSKVKIYSPDLLLTNKTII